MIWQTETTLSYRETELDLRTCMMSLPTEDSQQDRGRDGRDTVYLRVEIRGKYLQGFYLRWSAPPCPKREKSGCFGVGSCMCSSGAPALFCSSVYCAVRHPRIFQQNKETGDKNVRVQ